ncbi:MAG TPA: hypothetical protein VLL05_22005 [Terriglobales bacterium]|nr:hypothetical protein [Terriglobales bacterium]
MSQTTRWLAIGSSVAMLCCLGAAQQSSPKKTISLNSIVEALERAQEAVRPQVSYQVVREYRLFGTKDSGADSEVVAEIDFRPPARWDYRIQRSSGSHRGPQVVQRVLEHESERASRNNQARNALIRENYDFSYIGEAILDHQPCYLLQLKPRRRDPELISGQAWVDEHSFLVRHIEGELAKSPSWWLKNVRVKLTFANVDGTWLQTGMEAVADVRIGGTHTLISRVLDFRSAGEVAFAKPATRSATRNHP